MAKENNKNDKQKSALDKVIMGAIIGTAIGSAVGMSMAPKKGSEMREAAKEKGTGLFKVVKKLLRRVFRDKKNELSAEGMKALPNEMETLPPKSVDHE